MKKHIIFAALAAVTGVACVPAEGALTEQPGTFGPQPAMMALGGGAGGPEYTTGQWAQGTLVNVYGEAAVELWDLLAAAGFYRITRDDGYDYLLGYYVGCVSDGSEAACQLLAQQVEIMADPYVFTVHGVRFDSAASELFGAIAAATGVNPADFYALRSGRYDCAKTEHAVWCGLLPGAEPVQPARLELALDKLEDLGPDYVYEGWLVTDDGPVSSGRFDLGGSDSLSFAVERELAAASNLFVLTIEPRFNDDPAPAHTHVVAGAFDDASAELSAAHPAALATDFAEAIGGYILQTPSSAAADDYASGVWFLDPVAGPAASLHLPTLPQGWVYEGWVAGADGPLSTGRFGSVFGADNDGAGGTAGPLDTPLFPGQDFVDPLRVLTDGYAVVISVEPEPDNSPLPFSLKPLLDHDVTDTGAGGFQALGNEAATTLPTGFATLHDVN